MAAQFVAHWVPRAAWNTFGESFIFPLQSRPDADTIFISRAACGALDHGRDHMLVRALGACAECTAGDMTRLREILHPDKEDLAIRYSLAHAELVPGTSSVPHRLKTSEVYYVLQGRGTMHINGQSRDVQVGDTVYIPPGAVQHITAGAGGELRFLCIVDPAWRPADEETLPHVSD
jgi:mannose-6-phosphate isomerase-like protein (cupin superfamily)